MKDIKTAGKQIGYTKKEKTSIICNSARVPGDDENTEGDNNAEYLTNAMKKEVIIEAR